MSRARDIASHGYTSTNANILINPSFTVAQRGTSVTLANSGYALDRWSVSGLSSVGGTSVNVLQDINAPYSRMKVLNTGTTTGHSFALQVIEAVNILGSYGKELTLSFGYSSCSSTAPVVTLIQYDSSGGVNYIATDAAVTAYGANKYKYTFTLPSQSISDTPALSEKALQVRITADGAANAPAEWYLWETKLEAGSEATPFVARPYSEELALCLRYFWRIAKEVIYHNITNMAGFSPTNAYGTLPFPVRMRAAPASTNSGADDFYISGAGVNHVPTSIYTDSMTTWSTQLTVIATGLTNGSAYWLRFSNSANADEYLDFDAEL